MHIRKLALLASVLSVSLAGPVLAADAIIQQPPAPPVADQAVKTFVWTGGYVGGYGDYKWDKHSATGTTAKDPGLGVYGGYNWQNGNIIYGGEADIGYSGADTSSGGLTAKQGVNGSLRARMGFDVNPFMLYATGGVAVSRAKLSDAAGSDSKTHFGWTAGLGAETFLTNNITARLEYRYTDFNKKTYNLGGNTVRSGFDENSMRVGLGMKF